MKVLVVDDDVVSRMMLMHLVDSCGKYEILEAEDGADAWRQLQAGLQSGSLPAIVFCDLRMPGLSGTELLARVRATTELAGLPFVLVSAANDAATMGEAEALGANGYVVKPFRIEGLRPHLMALAADEDPATSARRLGIGPDRLALYLGGLARQLNEGEAFIDAALARGEADAVAERLRRLREGCTTLGLHGAATALARAEAAPRPTLAAQALATARAAVARQSAALEAS
ncbi:response regulator [Massilia sp. Leaf139]|uniref:response regulator n=1 Tax=Massilia sp. Leaf139 TaxID=1736272 RepID=UPI0006F298B3|nr:response regulator [Massilia sp. Leaf139]KQQ86720.1 response regulator receiver protein [Massilia sp. Leaf139]